MKQVFPQVYGIRLPLDAEQPNTSGRKAMNCGMTTNIKNLIKILMQDGQRKTMKHFSDIKTMQK